MGNKVSSIKDFINDKINNQMFHPYGYIDNAEDYEYIKEHEKNWYRRTIRSKKYANLKTEYWLSGMESKVLKNIDTSATNKITIEHDNNKGINVLFCFHGNGETSLHSLHYLQPLVNKLKNKYLIVLVEYPYYGYNLTKDRIRPSETECYEMSYAVYIDVLKLLSLQYISINTINLFGRSIGTGIAVWMSTVCDYLDKLILIHPFMSIVEVPLGIQRKWNTDNEMNIILNQCNKFDSFTTIEMSKAKRVLIIHANNDPLINICHSKQLYKKLNFMLRIKTYLIIVPNGGHECDFLLPKEYFKFKSNEKKNIINNPHCSKLIECNLAEFRLPSGNKRYGGTVVGLPSLYVTVHEDVKDFILYDYNKIKYNKRQ